MSDRAMIDAEGAITRSPVESPGAPIEHLYASFQDRLYLPDTTYIDVALATYVAHLLGGDPVWTLLIGTPSSGKTEVLRALYGLPQVHFISSLTSQTFASGMKGKGKRHASLLHRMDETGQSFLVLKDFTTVLSMHRDTRLEILAQLREIYDGSFVKEFGTGDTVAWEGRMGLVAGVTQVIDQHRVVSALLGERFIHVRLPRQNQWEVAKRALAEMGNEKEMRESFQREVHDFVGGLNLDHIALSKELTERIGNLAIFTTWARSGVERDGYSRDITAAPQPESPARFAKQVAALGGALRVMGHEETSTGDILTRVAYESVPPPRLDAIRLLGAVDDELETEVIADAIDLPTSTARRVLEDLTALKMMRRIGGPGGVGRSHRWALADDAREIWEGADPAPHSAAASPPRNVGTPSQQAL